MASPRTVRCNEAMVESPSQLKVKIVPCGFDSIVAVGPMGLEPSVPIRDPNFTVYGNQMYYPYTNTPYSCCFLLTIVMPSGFHTHTAHIYSVEQSMEYRVSQRLLRTQGHNDRIKLKSSYPARAPCFFRAPHTCTLYDSSCFSFLCLFFCIQGSPPWKYEYGVFNKAIHTVFVPDETPQIHV